MIRLSVFYPAGDDITFDHDYYRDSHVPLCESTWNATATIDRGVNGPYVAAVHVMFDSMDHFQEAMASPDSAALRADVPNYTNATPIIQVSETS